MKSWRAFGRLKPSERSLAFEAALALTFTWLGLRIFGFRNWKTLTDQLTPLRPQPAESADRSIATSTIATIEAAAARHLFFTPTCLEQSLVLAAMLRRRGFDAALRIGARKQTGRFEAHAWVDVEGATLDPAAGAPADFVPFEDSSLALRKRASAGGPSR